MFLHGKELIQPANVGTPDARFGTYLLEQFGGATGELTAALQYWVQSFSHGASILLRSNPPLSKTSAAMCASGLIPPSSTG